MRGVVGRSMAAALPRHDFGEATSVRRRATSFVLAALANALLLLMLFTLAPSPEPRVGRESGITSVTLLPDTPAPRAEAKAPEQAAKPPATPKPKAKAPIPPPIVQLPPRPLDMIVLSREEFAASDIATLPKAAAQPQAGGGARSGDTKRAGGQGPNGEPLYAAEWYREPTDAELGGYLRGPVPDGGWALIACRTVANYRVEDCAELGQSPPGSGLARAMRQAAWQFRVRPPRIGGKTMVGTWVSIRIDFTQRVAG